MTSFQPKACREKISLQKALKRTNPEGDELFHKAQTGKGPVAEDCFAVNERLSNEAPTATVVAGVSMIPQDEVLPGRNDGLAEGAIVLKLRP